MEGAYFTTLRYTHTLMDRFISIDFPISFTDVLKHLHFSFEQRTPTQQANFMLFIVKEKLLPAHHFYKLEGLPPIVMRLLDLFLSLHQQDW